MSTYLSNRNSDGYTDENGHFRFALKLVDGEILEGLEVSAQSTPNMSVVVSAGEAKIPYSDYAYAVWSDSNETLSVGTSSSTYPRVDRVVAYVDRSMSFTSSDINNPGALKFKVVAGTPANPAVAPTDSTVQNSVGAGNPWIELAKINVAIGATSITSSNIDGSDRQSVSLSSNVKTPEISTLDGTAIKFVVIGENDDLPDPIENTTLVVLVAKN